MKSAPHLPPQVARHSWREQLKKIAWIGLMVLTAWLAGFTGALMVAGWFMPQVTTDNIVRFNAQNKSGAISPDPFLAKQINQRLVSIYDVRKKVEGKFYTDEALVTPAAIISSDGWLVAYLNKNNLGQEKNWEVVDFQGQAFKISKSLYDPISHLSYFKINGNGFRINSFTNLKNFDLGTSVWAWDKKNWQMTFFDNFDLLDLAGKKDQVIWKPIYNRVLSPVPIMGSLLFDNKGELIGVAGELGRIIDNNFIASQVQSILSKENFEYRGFDLSGFWVKKVFWNNNWQEVNGFYVSQAKTKSTATTIGKGDVILEIDGELVLEHLLYEQILQAPDELELTIWRAGETIIIKAKKTVVYP